MPLSWDCLPRLDASKVIVPWDLSLPGREICLVEYNVLLLLLVVVVVLFLFIFQDRVFLCSPGCLGTHSVDQAGLELTEISLCLWVLESLCFHHCLADLTIVLQQWADLCCSLVP